MQLQVMNNDLAIRQKLIDRNLAAMTQLMQHNAATLEAAGEKSENMLRVITSSRNERKLALFTQQLERLRGSTQELNSKTVGMESRASAMKEGQNDMLRNPR